MAEAEKPAPEPATKRSSRARKWLIALTVVLAIVGALAFAISRAPDYLARYVVRNYFQGLNIDTSGVETININPLRGEINFGPVTFKGGEGEAGQVGQLGLKIDVTRLFRKQAVLEAVLIEGIRIDIRQAANGEISINGIPLTRILAEQAAKRPGGPTPPPAPSGAPPSVAERIPWGAGLDRLELHDSRLVFTSARGGEATINVNELDLEGFATWAPEDPGRFRLDGDLNQIHIAVNGTATPFARSVGIDAKVEVTGIELAKIERFAGPLGFSPNAGRADVAVESQGSIVTAEGRIEANLKGQAKLTGIDMASPDFGSIRVADGAVNMNDIHVQADARGKVDVAGDASIDLGAMALRLDDGTAVGFDKATVGLPALTAAIPVGAPPVFKVIPQLDVQALTLGGPDVQGRIATAAIRLSQFDLDARADGTPLTATGAATVSGLDLTLPDVEPIRITSDTVKAELAAARFAFPAGSTGVDGGFGIDAANFLLTISEAATGRGGPPPAIRVSAATLSGKLPKLAVDDGKAGTKVKIIAPLLALDRFRLEAPTEPGSDLLLTGGAVQLKSVDMDVLDAEKLVVSGRVGLSAPNLAVALREGAQKREATGASLGGVAIDLKQFSYREAGPVTGIGMKGRIASDSVKARIAGVGSEPAKAIDAAGLDLVVDDLAMEEGGTAAKTMRARLDLGLRSLEATLPGGSMPAVANVRDVRLVGAEANAAAPGTYGFERLTIGKFDVSLTRRAPSAEQAAAAKTAPAAKAGAKPEDKAPRTWPPKDLPVIRIGQLGLVESSKISMIDQTLSPPAVATIHLDTLSLQNVDSTNPSSRADLRLKARLENAQITVDGWALPFKPRPDFDLSAKINELVLPTLNPYLGPQIGLDIVEGKLVADAAGKAAAGQLKGELHATVADLSFADRANAGGDRVSKSVGVPLSTIIGLLEDPDGTIDITLPFEGDLLSPGFDYSDMIWSGLYRVLRALVTSPFKLVSASVSLLSATDSGSGGSGTALATPASAPALAPLAFAPGEAALSGAARDTVTGLRQTLKDRPRMRLSLCGVATAQDLDHLIGDIPEKERAAATAKALVELRELARSRMMQVRDALTDGTGIDRARVPVCAEPHADPADRGAPRVDLGF